MKYPEALAWLYGTQERGIKLGLDRVREFLAMLGWDAGATRYVHVAGTNGKGSVCAMVEAICRAGGTRTGLFTSPHLVEFRERIRVNGEAIVDVEAFYRRLWAQPVSQPLELRVRRDGALRTIAVQLRDRYATVGPLNP